MRQCSKTGCRGGAVATLTYVYADQTAVLGPLATYAEPHSYDLCARHAERLTVPRGWEAVRLDIDYSVPPPSTDDLLALADAVREAARPRPHASASVPPTRSAASDHGDPTEGVRRGHLRVMRSP